MKFTFQKSLEVMDKRTEEKTLAVKNAFITPDGLFAYHNSAGAAKQFTVTHLPTGAKLAAFYRQWQARRLCELLSTTHFEVPWDSTPSGDSLQAIAQHFLLNKQQTYSLIDSVARLTSRKEATNG